mgnify:CR=1 FL=1
MIGKSTRNLLWLIGVLCVSGCNIAESNEVIILLPGQIGGKPLVLGQTSTSQVFVITHGAGGHMVVPSKILRVWWNDKIIITENHPMKPRNKFPGDSYEVPDRTQVCWYLVDLRNDDVRRFQDYKLLSSYMEAIGVDPSQADLMNLRDAQRLREKELGFKFTPQSVNRFLRSGNTSPK